MSRALWVTFITAWLAGCSLLIDTGDLGGDQPTQCYDLEDWSPVHFEVMDLDAPTESLRLDMMTGPYVVNTNANAFLHDPNGSPLGYIQEVAGIVFLVANGFSIAPDATLRVAGERPLVIVSFENIFVLGAIDAGSNVDFEGPAANGPLCAALPPGDDGSEGGGGGAGAGFATGGGNGGPGGDGMPGADGAVPFVLPDGLVGGCRGGDAGNSGGPSPRGGFGGGAIQLTARCEVVIGGTISAGGEGGETSSDRSGGGGGGSGGLIVVSAQRIRLESAGLLAVNGGGGGGGSNFGGSSPGGDGQAETTRAPGGNGGNGGDGGDGGAGNPGESGDFAVAGGGGGGGGGSGYVSLHVQIESLLGMISGIDVRP